MKKITSFPEISLDRSAHAPALRQQIENQLALAIRNGTLPSGSRLPSSRCLAHWLNVSRGTVVDACDALLATGILLAKPSSGITVAPPSPRVPNFSNLRRTARAAHYPARLGHFEDDDGTPLYLNLGQ